MTKPRLGGWLRLWIILCVVYSAVVAIVTVINMPSKAPTPTAVEFLGAISDESLLVMLRAINPDSLEKSDRVELENLRGRAEAKRRGISLGPSAKTTQDQGWRSDPLVLEMSDGFKTFLPADVTKAEQSRIRNEYENIMATRLVDYRRSAIRSALVWWLIPCILILCAGLAARWVYRGFRGAQT